ncbi:MAG: putative ABC transporter permease subunit, partial [Acidobacteriota bacterium]
MNATFRWNSARAAGRTLLAGDARARLAAVAGLAALLVFAGLETAGLEGALRASRNALGELPEIRPAYLVERLLALAFAAALALGFLGSLTTAISTLFLSDELAALSVLPFPHRRLVLRQAFLTLALASAPTLLLSVPALLVAARASRRPLLAFGAGAVPLAGVMLLASSAGIAAALLLVRLVPPRRARLLAAFLSATGLAVALVGFRASRPERLLDPVEALSVVTRLGAVRPSSPGLQPAAWAARAATRGLFAEPDGVLPGAALFFAGLAVFILVPAALWRLHLHVFRDSAQATAPAGRARRGAEARSLGGVLFRAEAATLLRDASTPAQLGSLAAVFLLGLMNVRLLPGTDATARDLVAGMQTGLSLFLVSALSLRFAYPSVSSDGRAALVLRTLPLDARRHLLVRWAVRALPAAGVALALTGASLFALRPGITTSALALVAALAGSLAIPALHVGLGALFPRYDAPNAVSVALSTGGLFALVFSTALSLFSTLLVSNELRLLVGATLKMRMEPWLLLTGFLLLAAAAAIAAMTLAARSLERHDV